MQVTQLVRGLLEKLHVSAHALHQRPTERLFLGEHAAGARRKHEHRTGLVED